MSTPPLVLYVLSTPVASTDFSGLGRRFLANSAIETNNKRATETTAVNTGRMATSLGSVPVDKVTRHGENYYCREVDRLTRKELVRSHAGTRESICRAKPESKSALYSRFLALSMRMV